MFLYLDGCDDLINLDKVLRIEFRNAQGSLTARAFGELTSTEEVHRAHVFYDYRGPNGSPHLETYYNTSAQELHRKVRDYFGQ